MSNTRSLPWLALTGLLGCALAPPQAAPAPTAVPPSTPAASAVPEPEPAASSTPAPAPVVNKPLGPAPPAEPLRDPVMVTIPGPKPAPAAGETIGSGTKGSPTRDTSGASALELSGIGEGGGGRGEGVGLGSVGTIGRGAGPGTGSGFGSGHGRLGRSPKARPPRARTGRASVSGRRPPSARQPSGGVKAGEWNDNANFQEFIRYLTKQRKLGYERADLSQRRFVVVQDSAGKPVPNCEVQIGFPRPQLKLRTGADGRALFFPRAEGFSGGRVSVTAQCGEHAASIPASLRGRDGVIKLTLAAPRALPAVRTVDIAFILDTTGSMSEEINALKETIREVSKVIESAGVHMRVGLVEYRDRSDPFVARIHAMTTDVEAFRTRVASLTAHGGGDIPEDVNQGLKAAFDGLSWSPTSLARVAFLIGDAPPKMGYGGPSYLDSAKKANREGIRVYTVAASGQDTLGQVVWRQIAQYTGGTNMFVLRGGAGPASTGGGKPTSSCGGTQESFTSGNLARLISDRVKGELDALERNPLRIAGLNKDEKAKPCGQRISQHP